MWINSERGEIGLRKSRAAQAAGASMAEEDDDIEVHSKKITKCPISQQV